MTPPQSQSVETIDVSSSKRVLDPIDRVSEVLFGLIMVLGFTGTLSVAEAGRSDIHAMLIGALGCNVAWGIIDAVMYLMGGLADQAHGIIAVREVRAAKTREEAHQRIASVLPPVVARAMEPAQFDKILEQIQQLPDPLPRPWLNKKNWLGALAVFILVFTSTLPVLIPFLLMHEAIPALRVSNLIAIGMLFITGYWFGRCANHHPILTGAAMVVFGAALSGLSIALGG